MHYIIFCITILTLFGCLESKRPEPRRPKFPPGPSASARARLRSNRLKLKNHLRVQRQKCPFPTTSCLIAPSNYSSNSTSPVLNSSFECIDLEQELTACGTCNNDCTLLPNVGSVGCEQGSCKIFTCQPGFSWTQVVDQNTGELVTLCI